MDSVVGTRREVDGSFSFSSPLSLPLLLSLSLSDPLSLFPWTPTQVAYEEEPFWGHDVLAGGWKGAAVAAAAHAAQAAGEEAAEAAEAAEMASSMDAGAIVADADAGEEARSGARASIDAAAAALPARHSAPRGPRTRREAAGLERLGGLIREACLSVSSNHGGQQGEES